MDIDRPTWDTYFMSMCMLVAQRSIDPSTKHGCVVVDDDKTILSVGYNSPPRNCDDSLIPSSRPEKYSWYEHAESNAINNAARTGISLKGSTFYISGHPCEQCFRKMINVGCKKIIYGPVSSVCVDVSNRDIIMDMNSMNKIDFVQFGHNTEEINRIIDLLHKSSSYFENKSGYNVA